MRIELASDWPAEKLAPYGPDLTAAFHKLAQRFPKEVTVSGLFEEFALGRRQLWLILDDDGGFISFVMGEIQVNNHTGWKTLVLPSFAGERGHECVPMIAALEEYGREHDCREIIPWGRKGWTEPLAKLGYRPDNIVIFRKSLV